MVFSDSDKLVAVASDNKFFTISDFEQHIFQSNLCPCSRLNMSGNFATGYSEKKT